MFPENNLETQKLSDMELKPFIQMIIPISRWNQFITEVVLCVRAENVGHT